MGKKIKPSKLRVIMDVVHDTGKKDQEDERIVVRVDDATDNQYDEEVFLDFAKNVPSAMISFVTLDSFIRELKRKGYQIMKVDDD